MSESVNYMSAREFQADGFLQEANRLFFHPLGLALEVRVPKRPMTVRERLRWAWRVFRNSDDGWMSGVWDYRDDPEGMCFGQSMIDSEKAALVAVLAAQKAISRRDLLGYVIQPVEWSSKDER